jgi:short-subunit dehydrogenase
MAYRWADKVVLVTGASSGIGRALALELAKRGAPVALLARRVEALTQLANEIESAGGKALVLPADVRNVAEVENAVARVHELWGPIDVLVANAGMSTTTAATNLRAREAGDVIAINVVGVINCVAAVLPEMLARSEGHLVAISSLASYRGMPKSGAYSASKAAVSTFFESLRVDLRASGIKVTTLHPGFIRTPMTAGRKMNLPFLMEVEPAANLIVRAIERGVRTFAFPWRLATIARLMKYLPDALYDRVASKRSFRD